MDTTERIKPSEQRKAIRRELKFPLMLLAICVSTVITGAILVPVMLIGIPVILLGMVFPLTIGDAAAQVISKYKIRAGSHFMSAFMKKAMGR